jgi:hypothetical protein
VAAFLHARFSTLFRSSNLARVMPKRKGRTSRRKGMDNIRDTRCMIANVNPRRPRRQNERRRRLALPQEVVEIRHRVRAESKRYRTTNWQMCHRRVRGQGCPLPLLLLLRKRIHYRKRSVTRRARSVSSTLRMAMMSVFYRARANMSSTRLVSTLGSWSCLVRVRSVDTVRWAPSMYGY